MRKLLRINEKVCLGFPGPAVVKNPPANAEETQETLASVLGLGRSPGVGNGNLLQARILEQVAISYSLGWEDPLE